MQAFKLDAQKLIAARHLQAGYNISRRCNAYHAPVTLTDRCCRPVLALTAQNSFKQIRLRLRKQLHQLPHVYVHSHSRLCIPRAEVEHKAQVLLKGELSLGGVSEPAADLSGLYKACVHSSEIVHKPCGLLQSALSFFVYLSLYHDLKAVFNTEPYRCKRFLLRTLMGSHPVVSADAVKGYLDKRLAACLPQQIKLLLRNEIPVCIQLKHHHITLVDLTDNFHKVWVEHRLSACYSEGVYSAFCSLIKQCTDILKAPLAHQRSIVRSIEAVQAVIVASARYHKVHFREIPVLILSVN